MLRSVGRKGLGSICDCASALRSVRNSAPNEISAGAADQSCRVLGLGPIGPSCQSARTFVGGCNNLLPGSVKQATQGLAFPNQSPSGLGTRDGPLQLTQVRGFIQLKTNLEVADNSGARRVQCIKVMKGSNAAQIGDTIMASVKDAQPRGKVKKGEVVTCIVVRAATHKLRRDGSEIRFDKNAVVLVNKQGEPIGTRVFGPVPHELRRRKLLKILTLAEYVV